jgi:MFS transporter, DHA2 family, multidrug resistance protein
MVAPILGPTIGGGLTETLNWRWNFYINVPIGALSLLLAFRYVPDTAVKQRSMDWWGFIFLAAFIAGLQYALDRGQQADWLDSPSIRMAVGVLVAGLVLFVWHAVTTRRHPLFSLRLFTDRNFTAATVVAAAMGLSLYGGMLLQPLFFEGILQFPTFETGLAMVPRGLGSLVSMLLVGRLLPRLGAKKLIYFGITVSLIGAWMLTRISLDATAHTTLVPFLLQGFGIGFVFIPLSAVAFATLPPGLATEAAGVYNLIRSIGSSIGISIVTVYMTRGGQASWSALRGFVDPYRHEVQQYLDPMRLKAQGAGLALIAQQAARQAQMLGLLQAFWLIVASFVAMIPLVMLLKPAERRAAPAVTVVE